MSGRKCVGSLEAHQVCECDGLADVYCFLLPSSLLTVAPLRDPKPI